MLNLLQSFIDTVTAVVNFVINMITSFIWFVTQIPTYIQMLTVMIGYLPAYVIPFCTLAISLSVVLWILGRKASTS